MTIRLSEKEKRGLDKLSKRAKVSASTFMRALLDNALSERETKTAALEKAKFLKAYKKLGMIKRFLDQAYE